MPLTFTIYKNNKYLYAKNIDNIFECCYCNQIIQLTKNNFIQTNTCYHHYCTKCFRRCIVESCKVDDLFVCDKQYCNTLISLKLIQKNIEFNIFYQYKCFYNKLLQPKCNNFNQKQYKKRLDPPKYDPNNNIYRNNNQNNNYNNNPPWSDDESNEENENNNQNNNQNNNPPWSDDESNEENENNNQNNNWTRPKEIDYDPPEFIPPTEEDSEEESEKNNNFFNSDLDEDNDEKSSNESLFNDNNNNIDNKQKEQDEIFAKNLSFEWNKEEELNNKKQELNDQSLAETLQIVENFQDCKLWKNINITFYDKCRINNTKCVLCLKMFTINDKIGEFKYCKHFFCLCRHYGNLCSIFCDIQRH